LQSFAPTFRVFCDIKPASFLSNKNKEFRELENEMLMLSMFLFLRVFSNFSTIHPFKETVIGICSARHRRLIVRKPRQAKAAAERRF